MNSVKNTRSKLYETSLLRKYFNEFFCAIIQSVLNKFEPEPRDRLCDIYVGFLWHIKNIKYFTEMNEFDNSCCEI